MRYIILVALILGACSRAPDQNTTQTTVELPSAQPAKLSLKELKSKFYPLLKECQKTGNQDVCDKSDNYSVEMQSRFKECWTPNKYVSCDRVKYPDGITPEGVQELNQTLVAVQNACDQKRDHENCEQVTRTADQMYMVTKQLCRFGDSQSCVVARNHELVYRLYRRVMKLSDECADLGGGISGAPVCDESNKVEMQLQRMGWCRSLLKLEACPTPQELKSDDELSKCNSGDGPCTPKMYDKLCSIGQTWACSGVNQEMNDRVTSSTIADVQEMFSEYNKSAKGCFDLKRDPNKRVKSCEDFQDYGEKLHDFGWCVIYGKLERCPSNQKSK
jgi:hypothetical protein